MAKQPAPGRTKSRLVPPLTPEQAAQLYECFLQDALDVARQVPAVSRFVAFTPAAGDGYFRRLAPDFDLLPQQGGTLSERLNYVLTTCLTQEYGKVVAMNSDSPSLPAVYVAQAYSLLDTADVVLGPAQDGGYYLIGLIRPQPGLIRPVQMSTPDVLRDTLALARAAGLRAALLPRWYDVDTAGDLARLRQELEMLPEEVALHTRRFFEE